MEEVCSGVSCNVVSCIIGLDSLKATRINDDSSSWTTNQDVRLRMDGLFELKEHAVLFTREFTALYTNGPAGGGGIRSISHLLVAFYFIFNNLNMLFSLFTDAALDIRKR